MGVEQSNLDIRTALFGGTGSVKVWDLLGARSAEPFSAVLLCELDPGGSVGIHQQQRDPEIILGLDGRGEATVAGVAEPLDPGVVVSVPFGATLSLRNLSNDDPLRYVIIKARSAGSERAP